MRRFLLAVALILTAVSAMTVAPAFAVDGLPSGVQLNNEPKLPPALAEQKAHGAQVYYLGKFDMMNGWVMIRTGQPEFYYATPGNKAIIMGILFDEDGQMITGDQLKALELARNQGVTNMMSSELAANQVPAGNPDVARAPAATPGTPAPATPTAPAVAATTGTPAAPAPAAPADAKKDQSSIFANLPPIKTKGSISDPASGAQAETGKPDANSPSMRLFTDVIRSTSIRWGRADVPAFWAFIDPNCPHCQYFLKQLEKKVTGGDLAVHIIPVGYTSESLQQAALLIGASDGPERMLAYAKGDASVLPLSKEIDTDAVAANVDLLRKWGLSGTPIIIYQTGKSGQIHMIRGRPLDLDQAIADLIKG